MSVRVRPAETPDCEQIAQIYRHYVENTVITFDYDSPTADDWDSKRRTIIERGRPFVVAVDDATEPDAPERGAAEPTDVVGFAYLSDFRPKRAYDWTTEDTIYLRPDATGRGLGATLMTALLTDLDPASVRRVVAVIAETESDASIRLHERFGFVATGTLTRIGYKFDRWIDCAVLQYEVPDA